MRAIWAREARRLAAAFVLGTRLPMPRVDLPADWLPRAAKHLPAVGLVVGGVAAASLWLGATVWPQPVPAILALAAALLLTGALHEDGLADTTDGLGGATVAGRLAIMKDSRLGTYGALALGLVLALQAGALASLPVPLAVAALVGGHAGARAAAVCVMRATPYAADPALAKVAAAPDRPRRGEVAWALAVALACLLPLVALSAGRALAAVGLGSALAALAAWRVCRSLGGHTGDVLGAVVTLFLTGFLLGAAMRLP